MINIAQCRQCGDIIESRTHHEYVTCMCGAISLDGGSAYWRTLVQNSFDDVIRLVEYVKGVTDERPLGCGGCREYKGLEICAACRAWYCVFCDGPTNEVTECDHLNNLILPGDYDV